jgi:hypothetical protein
MSGTKVVEVHVATAVEIRKCLNKEIFTSGFRLWKWYCVGIQRKVTAKVTIGLK